MPNNSFDEVCSRCSIVSGHPPHPAPPNHFHRFDPLQCPPRRRERAVALCQPGPFLYRAVVLFHYIVEVLALAQTDTARQNSLRFQPFDSRRKSRVLTHVDDSRPYAPELNKRCRSHLKPTNNSYRTDETYIKEKSEGKFLYRAVDSTGQTIDFLLTTKRDVAAR